MISGAGEVDIAGSSTFTGANTYTGGTNILAAAGLEVGAGTTTGSITGNVSLGNFSELFFNRTNPYSFAGIISGTGDVNQQGTSVLTLSGNNSYSGGTAITSGDLVVTNSQALGTGPVSLDSGAELRGSGAVTLANLVNFFNPTTNATLSAAAGGTFTLNQLDISNAAAITFGSSGNTGTVVIGPNAANTSTGNNVTVAFGTLRNGDGLSVLTDAGNTTTVNAGATLDLHDIPTGISALAGSGNVTLGSQKATLLTLDGGNFDGIISGAGALSINNLVIFTGADTYTGGATVALNSDLQLGNGGTTGSVTGAVVLRANAGLIFDRSNAYTFAGNITGNGNVQQFGSGVLTLTGHNSYSLGTIIDSGVLVAANSFALGTGPVTLSTGAELRGSGVVALNNLVQFNGGTTNATISATPGGTFTLNQLDISNTAAITFGSSGNTGTVVIGPSAANTATGNNVTVAFGTLRNGDGLSVLTDAGNTTTVNAGATLDLHDIPTGISSLAGSGKVTLGSQKATILTLDSGTFAGIISGAGQVEISGPAVFTGNNTYTGGTTVDASANLKVGGGGPTGSIAGNVSVGSGGESWTLLAPPLIPSAASFPALVLSMGERAAACSPSRETTTTRAEQKSEGGVLVVTNNSLGTGPVTLSTGAELRASGTVTLNTSAVNFASGTGNATISAAPGRTFTLNNLDTSNTFNLTFGSVGNTGTISLGSGVTVGNNIDSATVAFGTLLNGAEVSQLLANVVTIVNAGATLAIADLNTTVNSLEGSGSITLGTKTATVLTLQGATFGGVISGAGSVNVASQTIFTGANTYTGGTTIAAGQFMQLGNGTATGSIAGSVSLGNEAALEFDRSNAYNFGGAISGPGIVEQNGAGILTLSGANSYTGGTQINSGVLVVPNAGALGTGPVTLSTGAELRASSTMTLNTSAVNFASGTTNATISAAPGGTLTLNNLDPSNTTALTFGSAGNTGTVLIGSSASANEHLSFITVAFGTLKNAGGLSVLTNAPRVVGTTINSGATLAIADLNTTVNNLSGSGSVTLGTKTATVLTIQGLFGGVISGAGSVNVKGETVLSPAPIPTPVVPPSPPTSSCNWAVAQPPHRSWAPSPSLATSRPSFSTAAMPTTSAAPFPAPASSSKTAPASSLSLAPTATPAARRSTPASSLSPMPAPSAPAPSPSAMAPNCAAAAPSCSPIPSPTAAPAAPPSPPAASLPCPISPIADRASSSSAAPAMPEPSAFPAPELSPPAPAPRSKWPSARSATAAASIPSPATPSSPKSTSAPPLASAISTRP